MNLRFNKALDGSNVLVKAAPIRNLRFYVNKDGTMIIEDPEKWKVGGCISVPYETNRKLSIGNKINVLGLEYAKTPWKLGDSHMEICVKKQTIED